MPIWCLNGNASERSGERPPWGVIGQSLTSHCGEHPGEILLGEARAVLVSGAVAQLSGSEIAFRIVFRIGDDLAMVKNKRKTEWKCQVLNRTSVWWWIVIVVGY